MAFFRLYEVLTCDCWSEKPLAKGENILIQLALFLSHFYVLFEFVFS